MSDRDKDRHLGDSPGPPDDAARRRDERSQPSGARHDLTASITMLHGAPEDADAHELRVWAVMKLGERTRGAARRLLGLPALRGLRVTNLGDGRAKVVMMRAAEALIRKPRLRHRPASWQLAAAGAEFYGLEHGDIPADLRGFFATGSVLASYELADIDRVVCKLRALSQQERALFAVVARGLSGDVHELEESLDVYREYRDAYGAALRGASGRRQPSWHAAPQSAAPESEAGEEDPGDEPEVTDEVRALHALRGAERARAMAAQVAAERKNVLARALAGSGAAGAGQRRPADHVTTEQLWHYVDAAIAGELGGMAQWLPPGALGDRLVVGTGMLYAAASFAPETGLPALAHDLLLAGVAAVALAAVLSRLHLEAARGAGSADELGRAIGLAAEAQVAGAVGAAMVSSSVATEICGQAGLPNRLQNMSVELEVARRDLGWAHRRERMLGMARSRLLGVLCDEHDALPHELELESHGHEGRLADIEIMPTEELFAELVRGHGPLTELLAGPNATRAMALLALGELPVGAGVPERVHGELRRAMRDALGAVYAHGDDVAAALRDAIEALEAARTIEATVLPIDELGRALEVQAQAARSAALAREALEQRVRSA